VLQDLPLFSRDNKTTRLVIYHLGNTVIILCFYIISPFIYQQQLEEYFTCQCTRTIFSP